MGRRSDYDPGNKMGMNRLPKYIISDENKAKAIPYDEDGDEIYGLLRNLYYLPIEDYYLETNPLDK